MIRNWWQRLLNRKPQPIRKRPSTLLRLEQLEDRCLMSVTGFSLIDQTNNNADMISGTANTDLLRHSPAAYKPVANGGDGLNTPSMTYGAPTFVAGPRLVSNTVSNQATVLFGPVDINTVNQNGLSDFGYTWGQFIDHDMDLTPDTPVNDFPIPKDPNHPEDPLSADPDNSLRMGRSVFDPTTGITTPREQINVNTSFLDLSQVYGSTLTVSSALRTGIGGRLKSSPGADGYLGTADDLLPFNNTTYFTTAQLAALNMANANPFVPSTDLFAAGDVRANETTELTALQTLFLRNHNAIAKQLQASHPGWTDEHLFQEARELNIAEEQKITYTAYLPALLGPTALGAYAGYNAGVNPSISTEFSTVAFRFGHSLLNNLVARVSNNGSSLGAIRLAESFFNPYLLTPGATDPFGHSSTDIGAILKGDADNSAQAMDVLAVSDIRNLLFGQGGPGEDLIARDIWRADDHGIGTYNQVRIAFGLAPITDTSFLVTDPTDGFQFVSHGFEQITSDVHVQRLLFDAFANPAIRPTFLANGKFAGDINPFIAGLAEDHVPGSDLGPLFHNILVDQFTRLRDGDRFFYLNQSFNAEEQAILNQGSTLARVIKARTGITNLQDDVFRVLAQEDGKTKSYYANQNGRAELTGSQNGTQLTATLHNGLVAALANPDHAGFTVLVDTHGHYVSASSLQSYNFVRNFLQNVSDDNVANKLSVQLLATEFNVLLGKVHATSSLYVPAITLSPDSDNDMGNNAQQSLKDHGVSNPSDIANIQDILDAAIAALRANSNTSDPSPDRLFQRALKGCFIAINSNQAVFIL